MFARTPIGKLLAFSGAQFGHPVYLSSVEPVTQSDQSSMIVAGAIHQANQQLLADHKQQSVDERVSIAVQFWNTVTANMSDWQAWEFRSATMKAAWKYHHKTPAADRSLCDIGIFRVPSTIP